MTAQLKYVNICLAAWLAVASGAALAADDEAAESAPVSAEMLPDIQDPVFDKWLDITLLALAVEEGDASLLTDLALQAAFGESVLERPHKALSSQELSELAFRAAQESGDKSSFERLAKLAKKTGDEKLAAKIAVASKLAGQSRAVSPSVSVDQVYQGDLVARNGYQKRIREAAIIGDYREVTKIKGEIEGSILPPVLRKELVQACARYEGNYDARKVEKVKGVISVCRQKRYPPTTIYNPPKTVYNPPRTDYNPPPITDYNPPKTDYNKPPVTDYTTVGDPGYPPAGESTITVQVTVPDGSWIVGINQVHQAGQDCFVLSTLRKHSGPATSAIAKVNDSIKVQIPANARVRHLILGGDQGVRGMHGVQGNGASQIDRLEFVNDAPKVLEELQRIKAKRIF